jgi:hypothetical protein
MPNPTELVGREEEIELLLRRWAKAKSGEGQVVLLLGEPGIGKSRLTAALLERLADEPHTRLRYFCSPQRTDSALYPIISQMERAAGLAHDDTPQAKLDKLDAVLAPTSTSIQDAALFAEMLSLPNDGRYPALELAPERRRQRTLEALTAQSEDRIDLRNRITIEIHTASFRSTRGYLIVAALMDEIAYLPADENSAEQDVEIINAIKPGMATVPDAVLLCASSPYARRGALWEAHRKHYGKDGDPVLVWQADTRSMNPSVPQSYIDMHMADDPARASAEYLAQFRSDLEAFVLREAVEACTGDFYEVGPSSDHTYRCFVDPASGSGQDAFAACITHRYGETVVVDAVREHRPPFSPEQVIAELATLAKAYRCSKVVGDHYAGEFPRELFRKNGLAYEPSKQTKSALYVDLLPLLNSRRIVLPRNDRLLNQIVSLERRVARSGHESIDHPTGQHDDAANACAGAAMAAFSYGGFSWDFVDGPDQPDDPAAAKQKQEAENRAWRVHQMMRANGIF